MNWKYAALAGFALAGFLWWKHRAPAVAPATGATRADVRGADGLALKQLALGPKAVAEGAKVAQLGETKAAARAAEKEQRKG